MLLCIRSRKPVSTQVFRGFESLPLRLKKISRCKRLQWELSEPATWDLPVPQTPTGPITLALALKQFGPDHLVDMYPNYYRIPSRRNVAREINTTQRDAGKAKGMGKRLPLTCLSTHTGSLSECETALRLWQQDF
jgi:hypothetical protein